MTDGTGTPAPAEAAPATPAPEAAAAALGGQQQPAGTPTPEAGQAATPEAPAGKSWADEIDEVAGDDKSIRDQLGRFTSRAEALKAIPGLRKDLSRAIFRPGKDAKPEDVAKYHKAMGVPEAPDKYEVQLPKDLPEHVSAEAIKPQIDEFLKVAHGAGYTPDQVNAAINFQVGMLAQQDPALAKAAEVVVDLFAKRQDWETELRTEWPGRDYGDNVAAANHAVQQFGGEDLQALLNESGLANHPVMIRALAKMGRQVAEGRFVPQDGGATMTSLEQEHSSLTEQIYNAQDKGDYDAVNRLTAQRSAISARMVGTAEPVKMTG